MKSTFQIDNWFNHISTSDIKLFKLFYEPYFSPFIDQKGYRIKSDWKNRYISFINHMVFSRLNYLTTNRIRFRIQI